MPDAPNFLSMLTGCFATPAAENPTVAMVEAAYRHHGIDARYINCDVSPERLGEAVRGALAMGWVGFNCSIPHKVSVIRHLDELAPSAAIIGAVNCVVIRQGRLVGENTDGKGFLTSLRTVIDPAGHAVVLFGAGGAARAIAVETALAGVARITIGNRDANRGRELSELIRTKTGAHASFAPWNGPFSIPQETRIVVNGTSIGLFPDTDARLDLETQTLLPGMVVADVIPNPPRTALIRDAEARGCLTLDGLGMLVDQGLLGIKLWTRHDVKREVMRRRLEEIFGVRGGLA
jgi:shikimate dehydrogenase